MAGGKSKKAGSRSMIECRTCKICVDLESCKGLTEMRVNLGPFKKNVIPYLALVKTITHLAILLLSRQFSSRQFSSQVVSSRQFSTHQFSDLTSRLKLHSQISSQF
ncbi:hypothetical protein FHG87_020224 [Trinorchestia longiramus]|nr:hypothetical protein FHG87_020224 [Trinorchestia longiramus]